MSAHWWSDWPKFLPGYLAFGATVVTQTQAYVGRRHRRRLGPADTEVRAQLTTARSLFEDMVNRGRRTDWFMDDERRETARKLRDLAERRADRKLTSSLNAVADAWDAAFGSAPGTLGPSFRWMGDEPTPQERERQAADQAAFERQTEIARGGLDHVKTALARLNVLERRTTGR